MTTIKKEIRAKGNTLMKNFDCEVLIKPSDKGSIRFFVKQDQTSFDAKVENVISTEHYVTLGSKDSRTLLGGYKYKIGLVEHFMGACSILGIDSIDVYVSEEELPIFDGSAKEWVRLFTEAGIVDKPKHQHFYTVSEPVYYLNGKTSMIILPDKELNITYSVNYDHDDLRHQWVSFDRKKMDEIIEARTFGFYKDLKKYQMLGFAQGVSLDNTVGLVDEGYMQELRSAKEPIKHKILDMFGDLYQTGVSPLDMKCQILVKEAGHAVHIKVANILKEKLIKIK